MSDFLPLVLGVKRQAVNEETGSRKKQASPSDWPVLRETVLKRDKFACRYCGFQARRFQRVHLKFGQITAMHADNLVTACTFCEQCYDLEGVGAMGSGVLIWLPEFEQAALNHLARAIYVAQAHGEGPIAEAAQTALDNLMVRRTEAKRRIGSDDPTILAAVFHEQLNDDEYAARGEKLAGLRLLPLPRRQVRGADGNEIDQFPEMVNYWISREGPYGDLPVSRWPDLFDQVMVA